MNRILVTGGAGYIGSHICLLLLERGFEVLVIDSFVNSSKNSLKRVLTILRKTESKNRDTLRISQG